MLEATFQRFGQKAAGMTEGRVRICNLYVFPNREQWQKSDIRVHRVAEGEKPGRAGSVAGGLGKANAWINATTGYYGAGEFEARALDFRLSNTLTHELGHYAFGLLDEYHERDVKKQATDVGVPRVTDVTLDTIMGRSQDFDAVSTPADYSKLVDGKNPREHTAQYRAWGMSGWEFLTVEEGKLAKSLGLKAGRERIKWAPLGGSAMPDNPLGNAPPGWDACFGIHFMVGKSIALILDDSGSTLQNPGSPNTPTDREIILQEGVAFVRTLEAGDRLQIWGHSDPIFPLSVIESDAPDGPVKQQAIAAIQAHSVEGPRGYYVTLAKAVGALLDKDDARVHFGER
ncbi:MAG TPA: hypothetical protein PKE00_16355, partial [Planctomycetota bacterium]|nr:hypothetical protein [Planctomycetota bacterium]